MNTNEEKAESDRKSQAGKVLASDRRSHPKRDDITTANARWEVKATSGRKTERLTARLTPDQDALIRYAAELTGTDITNFTVTTLMARALDILADRKLFVLDDAAWNEFQAQLDAPVSHKPRLEKLFSEPTIFDPRPTP
ncbi:DUF1778 domain-containing protein [Mycolicibacterium aichiense]|uniref:type II toxin-antitoxin system TacA family antitoxin n=1 Tax=Mycolicibacterium aichiense TaxID=1799 RepID=UPI003D66C5C8